MPASFSAGTTLTYQRTLADLPTSSNGWKLSVYLAGPAEVKQEDIAIANGVFTVLIPASVTQDLEPGGYRFVERIKENAPGVRVYDVCKGTVTVEPDLSGAANGSAMSYEAQVLTALKDKLLGRLTVDQEMLRAEGLEIARIPFEKLEALIAKYQTIVDLQQNPNAAIGSVEITFGRPS